jgi:hypothetical protein
VSVFIDLFDISYNTFIKGGPVETKKKLIAMQWRMYPKMKRNNHKKIKTAFLIIA